MGVREGDSRKLTLPLENQSYSLFERCKDLWSEGMRSVRQGVFSLRSDMWSKHKGFQEAEIGRIAI
jgi:hypothetical protein